MTSILKHIRRSSGNGSRRLTASGAAIYIDNLKITNDMKRFFWIALTSVMALALTVSCQKENVRESAGKESVRITVLSPNAADTRSIADGLSVNWVYWAAFDENGAPVSDLNGRIPMKDKEAGFDVDLVKDYPYNFVFWAQYEDDEKGQPAYDLTSFVSEAKIGISYEGVANDEYRDAFYKQQVITITGAGESRTISLTRPFAQINFLAADYKSVEEVDVHKSLKSTVAISGLPTVLNGLDGSVDGDGTTVLTSSAVPADPAYYTVNGVEYGWYSMNYILASEEKDLKKVTVTFTHDKSDIPVSVEVENIPYQRNHRTNIIGNFLTEIAEVKVIVMEEFDKPDFPVFDDGNSVVPPPVEIPEDGYERVVVGAEATYTVYNAEGLEAWRKEAHEGTFAGSDNKVEVINLVLAADIELPLPESGKSNWTPVGSASKPYDGFINGNGHTISNLTIVSNSTSSTAHIGFISNANNHPEDEVIIENIKFDNVNINTKGGRTGVVFGYVASKGGVIRNVHVLSGTVQSTSRYTGGIAGDTSEGNAVIDNCSNAADIIGGMSVGGIVGDGYVINSTNTGDVTGTSDWIGGITGGCIYKHTENCVNRGNISGVDYVAGIAGDGGAKECKNYGKITGRNYVGGIVGDSYDNYSISNCSNYGKVAGQDCTGGIVGRQTKNKTFVSLCYNYADVSGTKYVGGIAGNSINLSASENSGDVAGNDYVGGIVGEFSLGTLSTNTNKGIIRSQGGKVGLIFGNHKSGTVADDNVAGGKIE